ncbi:MAG: hypothetical protein H0W86_10500 [Armatimonadetes bacterium]|nr:hypothetical protein [Armatimonadota bacterium]
MFRFFTIGLALLTGVCAMTSHATAQGLPDIIYERPGARASTIDFSPDGLYLATGGLLEQNPWTFGQIKFWTAADGALLNTITLNMQLGFTNEVQFSPDGQRVASVNGTVDCGPKGGCFAHRPGQFVWSFPQGAVLASSTPSGIPAGIDYSSDGGMLATAEFYSSQAVKIYDSEFNLLRSLPGHEDGSFAVRFSPDGTLLASGGEDEDVRIWRVSDGALIRTLTGDDLADPVYISFSPDGSLIAAGYFGYEITVRVWRVSDGQLLYSIPADPYSSASTVVFTPDGRHFAAGTTTYIPGRGWIGLIRFWRSSDGKLVRRYEDDRVLDAGIGGFAISPSGATFAYGYAGRLILARSPVASRRSRR